MPMLLARHGHATQRCVVTAFFGELFALAVASCCCATGTESPGYPAVGGSPHNPHDENAVWGTRFGLFGTVPDVRESLTYKTDLKNIAD